ncbi:MAG: gliding motility lipoprotein GldK [Flavobacteriales bacterium]|nr:gliding motility lipoprotein GldK [Candidatus Arcticimaribacter sp.]|tara:strand:+ start:2648 stop:4018 length:1371 start_codon:yes stop_codon:yes gene_type:complete
MKKIFVLIATVLLLIGCGNKRGELVGVKQKKWFPEKPYGMTLVEGGAYIMGKADDDMAQLQNAQAKTVTVRSFYMDETEITNSEYRQFVYWVRDSVALAMLARKADELDLGEDAQDGIGEYAFADADTSDISEFQKYMKANYYDLSEDLYAGRPLNWDQDIQWTPEDYVDQAYVEIMDSLYLPPEVWYNGEMKMDINKLKYKYSWFDAEAAALARKRDPSMRDRLPFIKKEEIEIYPDTTVWIKDFNYSYNEPMHNDYFSHPAYQDYPVVGVSWVQAVAFCNWRTSFKNKYQRESNKPLVNYFRLPTEAEWEYAARGGIPSGIYPWGSPYLLNDRGCFLANFKPLRGDYSSDQAMYTVEAKSYLANDFNLYNMAGNVAEWTGSSYDPGAYEYVSSLNPNLSLNEEKRKVIRGGSWKDVAYFLRVSSRDYEYADTARSYIGFRTVQDYLGSEKVKIK